MAQTSRRGVVTKSFTEALQITFCPNTNWIYRVQFYTHTGSTFHDVKLVLNISKVFEFALL